MHMQCHIIGTNKYLIRLTYSQPSTCTDTKFSHTHGHRHCPRATTYLHIIIFTQVGQFHVKVGEVDPDGVSFGNADIPGSLLVVGVHVWEVRGRDPPIHFLQLDVAAHSMAKGR